MLMWGPYVRELKIGRSIARSEDFRLVRGQGRFTDDLAFPGEAFLYVLRSPHAAARIRSIDVEAARKTPGVLAVLTGEDCIRDCLDVIPSRVQRHLPDGSPHVAPPYRALAVNAVHHVGDAVAAVIATSQLAAKDAAERIVVDYESLPAVTRTREASKPSAPPVWDEAPNNVCFVYELGDRAGVDAAFARAAHVTRLEFDISRVSANPLEARNAIGLYDSGSGRYTLFAGLQSPHSLRTDIARILGVAEADLRVAAYECGGAFGMKEGVYPEMILVLWAARKVGRPVRWQSDRSEAFLADHQARDNASTVELALDADGRFLALRIRTVANLGAYLNSYGTHSPTNNLGGLAGTYTTPFIHASVTGIFSNTNPTSPYRGAGRPEASYAIERVIDVTATQIGIDRIELRRRNMIPPSAMPFRTGLIYTYDSGAFEENMDRALLLSDWANFEARRLEASRRGLLRGIGLASVIEIAGGPVMQPAEEYAEIRFDPGGSVTILTGTHAQGQGHETTFRQIACDLLGVEAESVRVTFGDTDQVPHGRGTVGSRSTSVVATSLHKAAEKIVARGKTIAAHMLEVSSDDVEFQDGRFVVSGTDRSVSLADVARAAFSPERLPKGIEAGFAESATVVPSAPTFPNGCHVAEVEIDPETGLTRLVGYWVVDDVGRVVNPALVKGQMHGGIAQGAGQALCEEIVHDADTGQPLTASFLDYHMPRCDDLPSLVVEANEVIATTNPFGIKGAGEAGTVGSLPAVMNAVNDALAGFGIYDFDPPASPFRVWQAMRSAREKDVAGKTGSSAVNARAIWDDDQR
jgi:carbon-monoxide dehydrogenase large subunit